MKCLLRLGIVVWLICGAFLSAQSNSSSTLRNYRYRLSTRSQESKFANEISPTALVGGTRYEVETDARGRTTRVAVMRNDQKLSEILYRFATEANLPSEYESFVAGEKTGVVRIQRDEAGNRSREDYFTVGGSLTRYEVYSYKLDPVENAHYAAEGKKTGYDVLYYSAKDTLIRDTQYLSSGPLDYVEIEFDDGTGHKKSRQQFKHGELSSTASYTYNADGDLVRTDVYDANHNWYSADEFNDNLRTKRIYQVKGERRELQYTYDEKRWLKESALYYKGVFVCRFVYERLPDGTAKRTRALGPNGELWAEYPDMQITDVKINGEALDGESIIHKTGNWWNPQSATGANGPIEILTDTMGVDFGPYLQQVVLASVRKNWYNLIPDSAKAPIEKKGKVIIEFSILKDGTVGGMKLVSTSGDVELDRGAWGGITASNPFRPLPDEFGGQYVAMRFTFYYNPDKADLAGAPASPTKTSSNYYNPDSALPANPPKTSSKSGITVSISQPYGIEVPIGGSEIIVATVTGSTNTAVKWSVTGSGCSGPACGTMSGDLYLSPKVLPSPPLVMLTATSQADSTASASVMVQLVQPNASR